MYAHTAHHMHLHISDKLVATDGDRELAMHAHLYIHTFRNVLVVDRLKVKASVVSLGNFVLNCSYK